ncbi:hypothetical protein MtrunA17_Chr8g0368791 [Medicago truncatula]|uniref:Uncharacterized protein n=1 Tax=Medicago truncatula TaxID=3880 RepID=A0A396GSE4_MEDTR|nr:hypothetical protein MtrunA17_Chr8g0368791 [Medicago truncatula]
MPGGPVQQIVDALLRMMFRKVNVASEPLTPMTLGSIISSSSGSRLDNALVKLKVSALDILEGVPFMLDASLNACAYGRVSTREMATILPCFIFKSSYIDLVRITTRD